MTPDTHFALFLMGELVAARRVNDADLLRQWLAVGIQYLGEPVVMELLLGWLYSSSRQKSRTGLRVGTWG